MRKTFGVSLLVLLLTGSAAAGEMPNLSPAPSATANTVQETTGGETPNGYMQNEAPDSLTQAVLDLLAALPSLL